MSKQTGLGDQLYVNGYDLAGDIQSIGGISTPIAALEMTGINKSAFERQYGLADAQAEFTSFFNDADDAAHEALSSLPRADGQVMYLRGAGAGRPAVGMVGKRIDYAGSRGDDGSLTFNVTAQGNGSVLDWAVQLSNGKETHASADSSASVDLGVASGSYGWQAYLQVFSIGSGSADIDIEASSDDGAIDTFASIGSFTTVTGRTVERIQSASDTSAAEQYVRVTTSGTFTDLVFAVIFNRNNGPRFVS